MRVCVCVRSDQPVSHSLCRRLPTDHVSGQLSFRVAVTSTGHEGVCVCVYIVLFGSHVNKQHTHLCTAFYATKNSFDCQ